MADDEKGTSGIVPGLAQEFIAQLRAITGRLEGLAGSGGRLAPAPRYSKGLKQCCAHRSGRPWTGGDFWGS